MAAMNMAPSDSAAASETCALGDSQGSGLSRATIHSSNFSGSILGTHHA